MFNWVDFVIIGILLVIVTAEVSRGFGKAVFDLAALLITLRLVSMFDDSLAGAIKLSSNAATNESIVFAVSLAVVGSLLVFIGSIIHGTTLVSADFFEPILGGICGIGVGIVLCHALVKTLALAAGPNVLPSPLAHSALGIEFLTFDTYKRLIEFLYNFNH